MKTAIVGINWGDEGKGRMVDLISRDYDIVVRYQGGNNAGHTVINEAGSFVLNLLPSGVLRPDTVNVMGNGMLIDISHLCGELDKLAAAGIRLTPERLKISDKACICLPCHKQLDILEEDRLADAKFGSTRRGIAPGYADKYMKKSLRMEDLFYLDSLLPRLEAFAQWKNLTVVNGYQGQPVEAPALLAWLRQYGERLLPYICDTTAYLSRAVERQQNILFEAQLGALRDIDFGIFPYTTSSNTLAAYAPIGAGIPGQQLDQVIGIIKAYSSCVGEGPFVSELFGPEGNALREAGAEYGAATGRPRRVGAFDLVASRWGVALQGVTSLALTKLDVLSYLERIPVCTHYLVNGQPSHSFPSGPALTTAQPQVEYMPGFGCDISACRRWEELPEAARNYVNYLEEGLGRPFRYISVGAEREQIICK